MGSVDPPRRLSSKLSTALCLGINHTNPLINLRPLLDNTNSPLQVIQAKTSREQGRGNPAGWRAAGLRVRVHPVRARARSLRAPRPDVCSQRRRWLLPQSLQQAERTEGWENRRSGFPPLRSPATDLILHERIFPFRSCLFVNHATPVHTQLKGWRHGGRWLRSREKPRSFEWWSRLLLLTAEGHSKSGKLRRVGDERWKERGRPSRSLQFYIHTLPFTELEVIYSLKWPSRTPPYT